MESNQNNCITLEMNMKIQMNDYRFALGIQKAWIIAIFASLCRIAIWYYKMHP